MGLAHINKPSFQSKVICCYFLSNRGWQLWNHFFPRYSKWIRKFGGLNQNVPFFLFFFFLICENKKKASTVIHFGNRILSFLFSSILQGQTKGFPSWVDAWGLFVAGSNPSCSHSQHFSHFSDHFSQSGCSKWTSMAGYSPLSMAWPHIKRIIES